MDAGIDLKHEITFMVTDECMAKLNEVSQFVEGGEVTKNYDKFMNMFLYAGLCSFSGFASKFVKQTPEQKQMMMDIRDKMRQNFTKEEFDLIQVTSLKESGE